MAEVKKIIHIENPDLNNLSARQLGVQANVDEDLNFRMWGGKDGLGNVSYWLAKDKQALVSDLTISNISGASGVLQHNASGVVSGEASINALSDVLVSSPLDGQVLIYSTSSSHWENATLTLDPTLDDCYDNDTLTRIITVDDGSVRWDLPSEDYDFVINLTEDEGTEYGFYVQDSLNDHFSVHRAPYSVGETTLWRLEVTSDIGTGTVRWDIACTDFIVASDQTIDLESSGAFDIESTSSGVSIKSSSSMLLRALGGTIYLNEAGDTTLDGSFTAISIVGALNELKTDPGNTLDDAYNADSGTRTITIDDGDVSWRPAPTTTNKFEVYQLGTGGLVNTVMRVHADGTGWGSGSKAFEIITDDDDAKPFSIVDGVTSTERIYMTRNRTLVFNGGTDNTISATSGGSSWLYLTTSGNGIIVIGGGTTSHSVQGNGCLLVSDELEVTNDAYFDGDVYLGNTTATGIFPSMTSTQRDSLSGINGRGIYNTTTSTIQMFSNGSWQDVGDIT